MDEKDNQHEVYMKLAELSHQACEFTKRLNTALKDAQLPIEFFSSFRYTENKRGKKGKNRSRALTHPIMLSLLHCLLQDISADSFSSLNLSLASSKRFYENHCSTPCLWARAILP